MLRCKYVVDLCQGLTKDIADLATEFTGDRPSVDDVSAFRTIGAGLRINIGSLERQIIGIC